ncbi:MAG: phosphatase PAP2 family protein [Parachlamydiaceae bacterium]
MDQRKILLFSVLFLIWFLIVGYFRTSFNTINMSINLWSASINTGPFTLTAQIISIFFDTTVLAIISFIAAGIFFFLHRGKYGVLLLGAMVGDALLVYLFKNVVMSPRPLNGIVAASGYSFPSGHTTGSVVFFGILIYLVWTNYSSFKVKALTSGLYVSITSIVGFDRIYLNVHWFSDVAGSIFLGAFWVSLCILIFKYLMGKEKFQRSEKMHNQNAFKGI